MSFFFLAKGDAKVTRGGKLLNMVSADEFFGEMAYIAGGEARHATVESHTDAAARRVRAARRSTR